MASSIKAERAVMTHEESELLARSHMPALREVDDDALAQTRKTVRELRGKERTFVRQVKRTIRGKAEQRGAGFPGEVGKPSLRKQFFSSALKRLNAEMARRRSSAAHDSLKAAARKALALRAKAPKAKRPAPGASANDGMRPVRNRKAETTVNRAKVGSVSQATKNAQAAKDNRG
ncbi:MAG: hypothetical protein DI565_07945 [Ancylobacter novellus]|uniref:Uncharacterized protein n=1 Tax=Ancylobacter novellus TaxID=921 RepID=A0A2W5MQ79_ANCNO|nr:MAG: hypothetical protein DI565_07945 [Ancylobacter novellus]